MDRLELVIPQVQRVWRHLLHASAHGQRRWPSVTALAVELSIPVSTTHRSLAHPVEIGAVTITAGGGLQVLDPVRLLTLFAGHRHLHRDITHRCRVDLPAGQVERLATNPETVLGGFGAVVAHHDGINRIADYNTVLFYGDPALPADLPTAAPGEGTEVLIATADPLLPRYGRVTPYAQAYADLFPYPAGKPPASSTPSTPTRSPATETSPCWSDHLYGRRHPPAIRLISSGSLWSQSSRWLARRVELGPTGLWHRRPGPRLGRAPLQTWAASGSLLLRVDPTGCIQRN